LAWWTAFLDILAEHRLGDLTGVIGLAVTIVGFAFTLVNVVRSREAAEKALIAAESARSDIRNFETVVDFAGAIALLEEIKRSHRQNEWALLPDRYAALRKTLIGIRKSRPDLSDQHATVVQGAIATLAQIERAVEKALPDVPPNSHVKFNSLLSTNIDDLTGVLTELKFAETGA
jgi:hypothetical protein